MNIIHSLALLCLIAVVPTIGEGLWKISLLVRFELSISGIGTNFFIEIPRNVSTAESKGWSNVTGPDAPSGYSSLSLYCSNQSYTVCMLADTDGEVAGVQVALRVDGFTPYFNLSNQLFFTNWTATLNGTSVDFYTVRQYFIAPDAADRQTRNSSVIPQGGVWLSDTDGDLYKVSSNTSDLVNNNTIFTKEACIPWMGHHYYRNMSSDLECTGDNLFPWFPLIYSNQYIGTGLMLFGTNTLQDGETDYFEHPTSSEVKLIVPTAPECLYDLAGSPGVVTMHTYYINTPWLVSCIIE